MPNVITYTWVDGTSGDWGTAGDWSGGVVPDGTANATIAGNATETVTVSSNQAVNLLTLNDANATLAVTNGATLSAFAGISDLAVKEIDIAGLTGNGTLLIGGGSQTLDNATINLGLWAPNYRYGLLTTDTASQTSAVLTLGPNLIINSAYGSIQSGFVAGDGIVNQGTINDTGSLSINGYTFTNQGSISGAGDFSVFTQSSFLNDTGKSISAGNVTISGGSSLNKGTISAVSNLQIFATFTNNGTISAQTISDGGSFSTSGPITNNGTISAQTLGLTVSSLVNNGSISGGGALQVSGSFDNENLIAGADGATLQFTDYGFGSNVNNGTISAGANGRIIFSNSSNPLSGSGSFVINDGSTLELQSGKLANTVNFAGVGTLQLDAANLFTGQISGLAVGDAIEFPHATITSAILNGTTLTVTYAGGQTTNLALAAPLPAGDSFQIAVDGSGGTEVVVANAPLPPPPTYMWVDGTSGDWGTAGDWSGGVVPDGTANATIAGNATETVTVSSNQAVNLLTLNDANATLAVTNGATLSAFAGISDLAVKEIDIANLTGPGTLLIGGGSQTLDNATINLGLWAPNYRYGLLTTDTASQTSAVLTLGPNLIINSAYGSIQSGFVAGDGIVNQGTINDTGSLSINGYTFTNQGSISGAGDFSVFTQSSFLNDTGKSISAGNVTISGGSSLNKGTVSAVSNLSIYGTFTNNGTISAQTVSDGNFTNGPITNNGTISAQTLGLTVSSLVNNGSISGGGALQVSGSFDNENLIAGADGATLQFTDYGFGSNVNNGTISAGANGRIIFSNSSNPLSGSGSFVINDGSTLELQSGKLANTVNFAGVGTLQLDAANLFTGQISGLAVGDAIEFPHATITSAILNGTTLTVTYAGGQTTNLALAAPLPAGDSFQIAVDGSGGTEVVVANAPLPPPPTYMWVDGTSGDWGTAGDWSGGVVPDGTANATIAGNATETVTVSSNQAVNLLTLNDANATLAVTNGATLSAFAGISDLAVKEIDIANLTGPGTLLIGGGSQTLDNATINLGLWAPNYRYGLLTTDTASQTSAVLTLGPNLIINSAYGSIQSGFVAGDGIVNQGTINDTGSLSINGYTFTNQGSISGAGDFSVFTQSSFLNDTGKSISAGNVTISGGSSLNKGTVSAVSNLSIYGTFTNNGTISAQTVSDGNFTNGPITNNGTISAQTLGLTVSSLVNNGSISGGGALQVSGSFDNENLIAGADGATLQFTDYGYGSNVNNGTISTGANGRIIFSNSSNPLSGSGSFVINDGSTLELQSGKLANTVNFAGVGTLQLDAANLFTGQISGLAVGDAIEFPHATITSAILNGTTLTITYAGGQTTNLALAAPLPAGENLTPELDGLGGARLAVTPATPSSPTFQVTSVTSSTDNGATVLGAGHVVTINITTSEPASISGSPSLSLNDGGTASYVSGTGTTTLTFSYLVAPGQNSSDLQLTGIVLNGGSLQDSEGNILMANFPADLGLQVDTAPPLVTSVVMQPSDADLNAGHTVVIKLELSETVFVSGGQPSLSLNDGGVAAFVDGSGSNELTFSYQVEAGQDTSDLAVTGVNLNSANITDAPGNFADLSAAITNPTGMVRIDTTAPTLSISSGGYTYSTPAAPTNYQTYVYALNNSGEVAGVYVDSTGHQHGFVYSNGNYTTLDPVADAQYTVAFGINDSDEVVGYYGDSSGHQHGFVYSNGNYTTLDDSAPGTQYTVAQAINGSGEVAGYYVDNTGHQHGFVYSNGNYVTLDAVGAQYTIAQAISDSGEVAGYYQDSTGHQHGFVYSNGNYVTLDPLGSQYTIAQAINDSGEVAGYYQDGTGHQHGFVYNNGNYITLDAVVGAQYTVGYGINDSGEVAGYYGDSTGHQHGFVYSNGNYITLDPAPGTQYSIAQAINDSGEVAGYYVDSAGGHGFVENTGNYLQFDDPVSGRVDTAVGLAINNAGQIAGYYSDGAGHQHGFLDSNGSLTTLDPVAGTQYSYVSGINSSGEVAGYYGDSAGHQHGFVYSNGNYTTLDAAAGAQFTGAFDVNDMGDVAGYYVDNAGHQHGFLYSNGNYTTLDAASGAQYTVAQAINGSDDVVGYYLDGTGHQHGFVYSNGNYITLDAVVGAQYTVGYGINDSGEVAGYYGDSTGHQHGFVYSNGNYITLDPVANAQYSAAVGINDSGEVVGYYGDSTGQHSFVYSNGSYTTLDDSAPGTQYTIAQAINDSGTVAGYYGDGTGQHVFVAQSTGSSPAIRASVDSGTPDLGVGRVVTITLHTSENVDVLGTPLLQLNNNEVATFVGGFGSQDLTFSYTVQAGNDVSDLQVIGLDLNNGNIADLAGNPLAGIVQADLGLRVDTTPPAASLEVNNVTADNVLNASEATGQVAVTGTVSGEVKDGDIVHLTVNGVDYSGAVSGGGFSINVSGSDLAADSDKTVEASLTTTDGAGNSTTATTAKTYSVVTTAPTASLTLNPITADNVINATEAGGVVSVTGTVGGDVHTGDTVSLTVNGNMYSGTVSGTTFSINVPGSALVSDGDHTVDASVTTADTAGNIATATATKLYNVDTTIVTPTVALTNDTGISNSDDITRDGSLTFSAAAADVSRSFAIDGGSSSSSYVNPTTDGLHTVVITDTDTAGNSASASISFMLDNTPPLASLTIDNVTADNIISGAEAGGTVAVTGTVGGDVHTGDIVSLMVNGTQYSGAVNDTTFSINVPGSALAADADHTVDASVTTADIAGNTAIATATKVYTVATTPQTVSLFGASSTPAASYNDNSPLEVGVKFTSSIAGEITALKFYRSAGDTGPDVLDLWSATGANLASVTFTNTTASGWQTVTLATPVDIAANTTYVASYHTDGTYAATTNFFTSATTSGPLTTTGGNGVYGYGGSDTTGIFPTNTYHAANYWADVVFSNSAGTGGADNAPVLAVQTGNQNAVVGSAFSLALPANTFTDVDAGDVLTYSATQANGSALPAWLTFDPATRTFSGTPGSADVGTLSVKTLATDLGNLSANETFNIDVTTTPPPTVSLFGASSTPAATYNDNSPLEVGVKFTSSVAGEITALKFYRSASDTGPDVLDLWSATGDKLASATFTNTAASGWQTVTLATPVDIAANTTYVASYHTTGAYAATTNFFTSPLTSGPLTTTGGNGVYGYGGNNTTGIFPTNTYNAANYWADVVFSNAAGTGGADNAPVLAVQTGNQNAVVGSAFSLALPANTFTDIDAGDVLTYSATQADGSALPAWLAFDPATRTFSGTPGSADVGTLSVKTLATDLGNLSASETFNIGVITTPPPTVSLFGASSTPAATYNDNSPLEVGVKFTSSVAGQVTALKFYRSAGDTGPDVLDLWSATGANLASVTFTNTAASGWQTVTLATPVDIDANTTYVASYHTTGAYAATSNFFTSALTSGPLTAPSSDTVGGNGVYAYGGSDTTGLFPTSSFHAANYGADVVFRQLVG